MGSVLRWASGVELASCQFQYYVGAGSWWAVLWDGIRSCTDCSAALPTLHRLTCCGMGIRRRTGILPVSIYVGAGSWWAVLWDGIRSCTDCSAALPTLHLVRLILGGQCFGMGSGAVLIALLHCPPYIKWCDCDCSCNFDISPG